MIGGSDVISAYGQIVEVGASSVKIGKIIGTFDNTKLLKSTANDINELERNFTEEKTETQWATNFNYTVGDVVYNDKKLYTAQTTGVSSTIAPVHTTGVVSDGAINWAYTSASGIYVVCLLYTSPSPRDS